LKIFLSWSGETSHKVSLIFRDWLPSVIQSIEPYVSSEDIDKGTRWSTDIAMELEESSYGILCVTPNNIEAPWLNFEAGALSKAFSKSNVSPFLFNVKRSEIKSGPLLQFQSTIYNKEDVYKLISGINNTIDKSSLTETRLKIIFDVWWPQLDTKLKALSVEVASKNSTKGEVDKENNTLQADILEEILELTRTQQRLLRTPHEIFPRQYFSEIVSNFIEKPELFFNKNSVEVLLQSINDLHRLIDTAREDGKRSLSIKRVEAIKNSMIGPADHIYKVATFKKDDNES
jgi:hypothetical protein